MNLRPLLLVLPLFFGCASGGGTADAEGDATEVKAKCAKCSGEDASAACTCEK